MAVVSTAAGTLFYVRRGSGGPPLICIHGAGGTYAQWGYQVRGLAATTQVYALDLPGHGRSPAPGRTTIEGYSAALRCFLDACRIERAVLVGHSLGGAVALRAALDMPDRVAGVGLIGTGGRLRVGPAILDGFSRDLAATIRLTVDLSYAASAPAWLRAHAEAAYARCDPVVYHGDFVACHVFDILARLAEICCPAAVICGAEDRLTPPRYSEALRERLPGATLTILPDAGHMAMVEQPEAVNEALRGLLRSL